MTKPSIEPLQSNDITGVDVISALLDAYRRFLDSSDPNSTFTRLLLVHLLSYAFPIHCIT